MPSNGKRSSATEAPTYPPDPGLQGALFLAWLMKRGGAKKLSYCKDKWNKSASFDVESFIASIKGEGKSLHDDDLIHIARSAGRGGAGKKYVALTDKGEDWAFKWTGEYKTRFPHHSHWRTI
jgi:hypothetical protein